MKANWLLCGLAAAGLGFAFIAHSQEPAPKAFEKNPDGQESANESDLMDSDRDRPKQVQVQIEFVEMSHEALTKLLFLAKPASSDATKLRQQVQEMVAKNEATILETQISIARSGQKATSESIHEFIYPTEYEPPELPGSFNSDKDSTPHSAANWTLGPVPTAFETRNLGSTLEIEPTIGEGEHIVDMRFVPELVWHTGDVTWHEGKDKLGNSFHVQMPHMYTLRLNTALTLISGQYTLAGVLSPKDEKGDTDMTRKVMVFVKCDVLVVK